MEENSVLAPERGSVTGHDLKAWGHRPGPRFKDLLERADVMLRDGASLDAVRAAFEAEKPPVVETRALRPEGAISFHANIEAEHPDEIDNVEKVRATMKALLRVPTIEAGAVMPDACPAGPLGVIPVGGVVAARNAIHPGMHSADICCSVMLTDFGAADPKAVLDAAFDLTHFGPGGRQEGLQWEPPAAILEALRENPFTNGDKTLRMTRSHFGTQGDGNHFLFVGRSRATGRTAMVTHHGSRGPGAMVYKAGMAAAEAFTRAASPETPKVNAWLDADSEAGRAYWAALQLMRAWTKANHAAIHDRTAATLGLEVQDRFWNEHNFVFERDGLYHHAKGATPAFPGWAHDATERTLIPLNMAEPILVTRGKNAAHGLGFAPHGAGRNFSRSEHKRRMGATTPDQALTQETEGLDIRFKAGGVDSSELPSSYKRADAIVDQIERYGLAAIDDYIDPFGCVMAGDLPPFWRAKKAKPRRAG